MRRLTIILFLFVLPAFCLWTPEEIVQLQNFSNGLAASESAMLNLGYSVNYCTIEGTTRPLISSAWHNISVAHRAWYHGYAFLIQANPETGTIGATIDGWPRPQWVSSAWANVDSVTPYVNAALASMTSAQAVPGISSACSTYFGYVKMYLTSAQSKIQAVDRTLTYASPFDSDYPQIIGPHGTRDDVMHLFYFATRFWDDMEDSAQALYSRTTETYAPTGYYALYRVLLRHVAMAGHVKQQWMRSAIILVNPGDCTLNAFHLVADYMGAVLSHTSGDTGFQDGMPYHARNLFGDSHAVLFNEVMSKSVQSQNDFNNLFQSLQNGWQYSDGAMWRAMQFPNPAKLGQVSGQATAPGGIYGPPACP